MARGRQPSALVKWVEWRLWRNTVAVNLIGVLLVAADAFAFSQILGPSYDFPRAAGLMMAAAVPFFMLMAGVALPMFSRRLRPATGWFIERRAPTGDERAALSGMPRFIAVYSLANWFSLLAWTAPYLHYVVGFRPGPLMFVKMSVAFAFAGIICSTLTYFVVERTLRSLLALAPPPDGFDQPKTLGMFPRLVIAFTVASGLPLAAIALTLIGLTPGQRAGANAAIITISLTGIATGIFTAVVSARAITDPLRKMRDRLREVEEGNLDAEMPVDETGEVALLQLGFNRMVAGLRERDHTRELFERHVGDEVARKALAGEVALGGELVDATAMFVDMIGSTEIAQSRPPKQVVELLNAFFDIVVRTVRAHGGMVNKFEGDGALCVFGATHYQRDHAARALRCAREIRHHVMEVPEAHRIDIAIGLSSGEMVAGNIGALDRYEYTVVGDPANEASRLTESAKGTIGRILASKSTIGRAGAEAEYWTAAGTIPLRGRPDATLAYQTVPVPMHENDPA